MIHARPDQNLLSSRPSATCWADWESPSKRLKLGRGETECCGFGGLQQNANPGAISEVARRRGQRSPRDYLTYCAMCRDSLASADKRALHLLDLLFPDPRVPTGRPA